MNCIRNIDGRNVKSGGRVLFTSIGLKSGVMVTAYDGFSASVGITETNITIVELNTGTVDVHMLQECFLLSTYDFDFQ